ncbi:hypothetical protein [Winogradskyella pulchriflava]|uniref:Outer membrane protein assembly factor BamE domain-containing protein n=1 Tax=Winogradskyella pulchriflava TaxID=1110688 RepID=A0ABV6Q4H6_9FLAO
MISRLKRNDKIGLFFFVAFILSSSLIWLFEERFDKEQWRSNPSLRYKMVDDVIESQLLIGKPKYEVIELLGQPSSRSSAEKDAFLYRIGRQPGFFETKREQLLIIFEAQTVVKVTIVEEE